MKAPKECAVEVIVSTTGSFALPGYINLIHRHLEKEGGPAKEMHGGVGYTGPLDLIRMTVPAAVVDGMEEITLVYEKATK